MEPESFRRFLASRGYRLLKSRPSGVEFWIRSGDAAPVSFYGEGPLLPRELGKIIGAMGLELKVLGEWRSANERK